MLPAYANLVYCPYCGATKELMQLASGNTFEARYWSDNKRIAPMLPEVSPVQKCPHCGKYYLEYKQKQSEADHYSSEKGELSFPEWKEAYHQFLGETESTDRHIRITEENLVDLRFWLVQAYNDYYHRNCEASPSPEDYAFIQGIIKDFINTFDWSSIDNPLLKAEFYREADMMHECAKVLLSINYEQLQDYEKNIYNAIKSRMERGDKDVFEIK